MGEMDDRLFAVAAWRDAPAHLLVYFVDISVWKRLDVATKQVEGGSMKSTLPISKKGPHNTPVIAKPATAGCGNPSLGGTIQNYLPLRFHVGDCHGIVSALRFRCLLMNHLDGSKEPSKLPGFLA